MTSLAPDDYLQHLRSESRRFREVLAGCDPAARVPGCPEWDAADLLWHLTRVQWFWAQTIRTRPAPASEDAPAPDRPATYDALLASFDEHSAALVAELESADPAEEAWSWSTEQTVGFTFRRQAHEAMVHRLDAEQAAGDVTPFDPALAADGVLECLEVMFGGLPPWGSFHGLPHHVRVDLTDTGDRIWVQLGTFSGTDPSSGTVYEGEPDIHVVPDPGVEADVRVEGPAGAMNAWLWRRGDDAEITVHGDRDVYDRFRESVNHPIN
jgi:uncharacterized protein (TIGR03083 family)